MAVVLEDLDHYLPVTLHKPGLTEDEWFEFCAKYHDFRLEYSAEGDLILMSGTNFITGNRNSWITEVLSMWARLDGRGRTGESSTSYLLPSAARRSPDASWISKDRLRALKLSSLKMPVMVPEFIVELKSPSDNRRQLRDKMEEWIDAGVQLGWLIDPEWKQVTIYRPNAAAVILEDLDSVAGDGPVEGFVLDLKPVWSDLDE
jgi:Uma2 family endonuclease